MPDFLDNFRFYEEAVREALAHLSQGMSNGAPAVRIHGAEVTSSGANYLVAAGAIFFGGEIYTVPAHTLPKLATGVAGTYYWDFEQTYAPEGWLSFEDLGVVNNCYAIRVAKLKKTTEILEGGAFVPKDVIRFQDVYTLKSSYDSLLTNFTALLTNFTALSKQVGGAYFHALAQSPDLNWLDLPTDIKFGNLISETAHLQMVSGGVYMVHVSKLSSPDGHLRLYHEGGEVGVLQLDRELFLGDNLVYVQGFAGVAHVAIQGKWINTETELSVHLIAVDTNASNGGIDDGGDLGG